MTLLEQYKIVEHMAKCKLYVQIDDTIYSVKDLLSREHYDCTSR